MRTVMDNIDKVLADPKNISARSHLQWAATCAINGWASPGDAWTPIHQVGHVLTALYKVPHGASLAILMPAWMEVMYPRKKDIYFRFATHVIGICPDGKSQEEVIREGITSFKAFLKRIGTPLSLTDMQVKNPDIPLIVQQVVKISFGSDGYLACNPPVSQKDIIEVLNKVL